MATGTNTPDCLDGAWHEGDLACLRAAYQGAWLGTAVFDGARLFEGVASDRPSQVNARAWALSGS
jgi:branched-chain amino acid aminotransferase